MGGSWVVEKKAKPPIPDKRIDDKPRDSQFVRGTATPDIKKRER